MVGGSTYSFYLYATYIVHVCNDQNDMIFVTAKIICTYGVLKLVTILINVYRAEVGGGGG